MIPCARAEGTRPAPRTPRAPSPGRRQMGREVSLDDAVGLALDGR